MLGAPRASRRAGQRLVRGELVRLEEGDPAIAVHVGGAAEAGHEVVGEIGGQDAIRLLGDLGLGARGEEGVAVHVDRLVDQEGRPDPSALEAGDGAGGAGVEDGDADVGGDLVDAGAEAAVG